MPGEDNLLNLGSKTLREKLSIDVMKQLRDTAAASEGDASITEHAPAEVPAMPPEIIGVRRVAVTIGTMQLADIEVEAAGEINWFEDVLLDRELEMMMSFSDREIQQREHVLEDAILRAARAGMPPNNLVELRRLVLGPYKEAFRWGLTGEPPVQVELVGGQTSVHTTFDPDSGQVTVRDLMDAQERMREEVMDLVRKNRARMRGVEWKGVLPDFAVEETIWEPMSTIYADAPKYVVTQLRKLRLTKEVRDDPKKKYGMKV